MSREQAAAEMRARITATDPALLDVVDALKDTFGARLKFIRLADGYIAGDEGSFNERGIIPASYRKPQKGGALAGLKEEEAAHIAAHAKQAGVAARGRAQRGRRP